MLLLIFEYLGAIAGISSASLVSLYPKLLREGVLLKAVASIFLGANAWWCKQYGVLLAQSVYLIVCSISVYKEYKAERNANGSV